MALQRAGLPDPQAGEDQRCHETSPPIRPCLAFELATIHDIPNVGESEYFWTDNRYVASDGFVYADIVNDNANFGNSVAPGSSRETVCVTTLTN
jgi:hypothetical protein